MSGIAIIIPTIGRPSLRATLESLKDQLAGDDRVLIVVDGHEHYERACREAEFVFFDTQATYRVYGAFSENQGCYGHPARNDALQMLSGLEDQPLVCWSLDDDDIATVGALDFIRAGAHENPGAFLIFRMQFGAGHPAAGLVLPNVQDVRMGEVGTPMIVAPVGAARYGMRSTDSLGREHGSGYLGDYDMAVECLREFGEPIWHEEVVAVIRPEAIDA